MATPRRVRIRTLFLTLVLGMTLIAVCTIVAFVARSGRDTVKDMTLHLAFEVNARLTSHVSRYLESVQQADELSAALVRTGCLDPHDERMLQDYLGLQLSVSPMASNVYFGNTNGGIIGAGRLDGESYVTSTKGFSAGEFRKIAVDDNGVHGEILAEAPYFDARAQVWYERAVTEDRPVWTGPYVISDRDMSVATSRPVYAADGSLSGVFTVDLALGQIGQFLAAMNVGGDGICLIIDEDARLMATSTGETPFPAGSRLGPASTLLPSESANSIVRLVAKHLPSTTELLGGDARGDAAAATRFRESGAWYVMVVDRLDHAATLPWHTVVVVPESSYLRMIHSSYRVAVFAILVALVLIALVIIRILWNVTGPLLHLTESLQSFEGERLPGIADDSRVYEISLLLDSFNRVGSQLRETLDLLNHEIDERTRSERQLEKALRERELLVRELSHRTKNNMNIISSMIHLQSAYIDDAAARVAFDELAGRVRSMSLVHEKLYRSTDFIARVNLDEYLVDLLALFERGAGLKQRSISIVTDVESVHASVDIAIPCGLLVNELITNSLKHAFEDRESGSIAVSLRQTDGMVELVVADDGAGFRDGFDPRQQRSLGLQVVYTIAERQLDGSVEYTSDHGVTCTCRFPLALRTDGE